MFSNFYFIKIKKFFNKNVFFIVFLKGYKINDFYKNKIFYYKFFKKNFL